MLTREEFMEVVLPPKGHYCVLALRGKRVHSQTFHTTKQEVDLAVDALEEKGLNSFIAVASYQRTDNRTVANVAEIRSFFLDLDCDDSVDDDKHYPTQGEAVVALKQLVKELKLPRPIVVNSGRGIHAYWPLVSAVPRDQWKPVAEKFKSVCLLKGMKIDPAVPADAARVLRAVGSSNFKDPLNPLKVDVLNSAAATEFDVFKGLLGVTESIADQTFRAPLDDTTKSLLANKPSNFRDILKKSLAGDGCNQLLLAVTDQENTSEPLWRAALSIAQHCKDRDKAIHAISNKHPQYSASETEEKASRIQGPYRCDTFWKNNPSGCDGCKHRGVIVSPIVLGKGLAEAAAPEDNIVQDAVEPTKTYEIPEYPWPYFRGKSGGIYCRSKNKEGEAEDVLVYENDFYLVNTVDDPVCGMSALFRVHLPQDGMREFMVPMQDMVGQDTFAKRLAKEGISALKKQMEALTVYSSRAIKTFQNRSKARKSRLQFGWADNYSAFIIGDRCITATEISYSPPSSVTIELVKFFRQEGTLEKWKEAVSHYNRPGMELHLFTLFGGFASPLSPFAKKKGSVLSLVSEQAGTGKTTMLKAINSVFGHPEELILIRNDTPKSRINRIGTMQNISPTIDEITNETPEHMSEFLYQYLHGRGGNRLQGSNNIERLNTTTWRSNCYVTANSFIEEKLYTKKRTPDGEMSRFLEFEWCQGNDYTKTESDAIFGLLDSNYGWAGDIYIQYVIRNLRTVQDTLDRMGLIIDTKANLGNRERFWSSLVATHLTGGLMARQAGVLDFTDDDFTRVVDWIVKELIDRCATAAKAVKNSHTTILGSFINDHVNDTLIINSTTTRKVPGLEAPIREPRQKLHIRFEPDTRMIYVRRSVFRKYCSESQTSYAQTLKHLKAEKKFIGERKMRLGKGMAFSQPEDVLVFDDSDAQLFKDTPVGAAHARDTDHDSLGEA